MKSIPRVRKASLGQCFLVDKGAIARIREILSNELDPTKLVLEIGPGAGVLTEILVEIGVEKILAVELDKFWIEYLKGKFGHIQGLELIPGDFRKLNFADRLTEQFYLVANIPYYISGEVLEFAYKSTGLARAYLMLQKDLVDKIASLVGSSKYSALSVIVQVFFELDELLILPPRSFSPAPKVWSSFIRLRPREETAGANREERKRFAALVKKAFSHRRKMLKHNLDGKILARLPKTWLNKRAQEIGPIEWWQCFRILEADGGKVH